MYDIINDMYGMMYDTMYVMLGLPPDQDPFDPWHGKCGTGKGADTYTSGIEGDYLNHTHYYQCLNIKQLVSVL